VDLYCAIDLIEGGAVRLLKGDFEAKTEFGDPLELARLYLSKGARWLHVVDLEAAKTGEPANRSVVLAIAAEAAASGSKVQAGGGVREVSDAEALLSQGVERVVVGTTAQRRPEVLGAMCERFPGRVGVGLDHRSGEQVEVSGWSEVSGASLGHALSRLRALPVASVVVTSIDRDGTLLGPDVESMRSVLERTEHPVVASGGVSGIEDLHMLRDVEVGGRRLEGVIVGMALASGTLDLEEALAACGTSV
jgi:phosphoribosylformimino-5-aminoimidazole carboxamide ribotide isomerase